MSGTYTLAAEDAEDLEIISAHLQDAVTRVKDLAWLPTAHRFAALFNRFKWEEVSRRDMDLRVRSGLCFENVLGAKAHNISYDNPEAVLSLLAIQFSQRSSEDPGGTVELVFSGGGALRLDVECIAATLADVSGEWAARGQPSHPEAT